MKKFLIFVLLLALAAAGAGYYLMTYRPDTPEGKWVKAQYDRFFPRPADAAPAAESVADAPESTSFTLSSSFKIYAVSSVITMLRSVQTVSAERG